MPNKDVLSWDILLNPARIFAILEKA
ncbi:hypothetical protein MED121_20586 [Marinomonas sp. MED121]|nr:hypothetical protein MED121_20586 [Marinomonas sp. MED121]